MKEDPNYEFGRADERALFVQTHKEFIRCRPLLYEAFTKVFFREYPSELPFQDFIVVALGRLCVEHFDDIELLCANRCGDGAFIIVRSMFEKLVNAHYIHAHPEKAESFRDFFFVHMRTVRNQIENTYGKESISDNYRSIVDTNFERVRQEFNFKTSKGKEKTRYSWSDKGLVDMAIEVGLQNFLVPAYYFPLEKAHPSVPSVMSQAMDLGQNKKLLFGKDFHREREVASDALMVAHQIIVKVLVLQCQHFQLSHLNLLIEKCQTECAAIWKGYRKKQP
jgi:Family of unknown function (DUF5677)